MEQPVVVHMSLVCKQTKPGPSWSVLQEASRSVNILLMVALATMLLVGSLAAPVLAAGGPPEPSGDGPLGPFADNVGSTHSGADEEEDGAEKDPEQAEEARDEAEPSDPSQDLSDGHTEEPAEDDGAAPVADDDPAPSPVTFGQVPPFVRAVLPPVSALDPDAPHLCPGDPRIQQDRCDGASAGAAQAPVTSPATAATEPPQGHDGFLRVGTAIGLGTFLLAVLYRLGMLLFGFRGLPLGFRMSRDALMGHPVRKAVLDRLEERPGATTQDLADAAGVTYGRVGYHLSILKREEAIRMRRVDGIKRWFGTGTPRIDDAALAQERLADPRRATGRMLAYLRAMPGASGSQVARAMGLSPGNVHYHVSGLDKQGLVRRVAQGRRIRHYLTDAGHAIVARLHEPSAAPAGMADGAVPA